MPFVVWAQVEQCIEVAADCREDCSLEHSSLRPDAPRKLARCLKKCQKKVTACEERELETKNNTFEADSIDRSSGGGDENVKKSLEADLRDDTPAPVPEPEKTTKPKLKPKIAESLPPREEVLDSEIPKSSRTVLKVDEKEAKQSPAPVVKKSVQVGGTPKPAIGEEEQPRVDRSKAEPPPAKKDDQPKKNEKLKDELPPLPPKPKEEDHDDLRNY
jgi:hypothetical protein